MITCFVLDLVFLCVTIGLHVVYIFVVVFPDFYFVFLVIVSKFARKSISRMHCFVGR